MSNEPKQLPLPLPQRTRVHLEDKELPPAVTRWELYEDPPCSGWWDVAVIEGMFDAGRWWWNGKTWRTPTRSIDGDRFRKEFAWRGLVKPSQDVVYPCPPYSSADLVPRAQASGLSLRTTYVSIAPMKRERVRL